MSVSEVESAWEALKDALQNLVTDPADPLPDDRPALMAVLWDPDRGDFFSVWADGAALTTDEVGPLIADAMQRWEDKHPSCR